MDKEVKAIVEYLNEEKEAIRKGFYYPNDVLSCEDLTMIIDYINQLEEENASLRTRVKTVKRNRKAETSKVRKLRGVITTKDKAAQCKNQRIKRAIELCNYLLKTDSVCINGKVYYKQKDDDVITKRIIEELEGDSNE